MSGEAEHTVTAAILQQPIRLLDVEALELAAFRDAAARRLFKLARDYRDAKAGKILLDLPLARALLERGAESAKAGALVPIVAEYATLQPISDAEFRDAVSTVVAARRKAVTREHATQALEASLAGKDSIARDQFQRGLMAAEDVDDDRPEDVRSQASFDAELAELRRPKTEGETFDIGFSFLTNKATFRRGQFTIIGGFAKDGKTQLAKAFAYNVAMLSGANVSYTSLEMDKREMRVLLVCHHASTIDPRGVPWTKILDKSASKPDRRLYARALLDFKIREGAGEDEDRVDRQGGSIFFWCPRRRPTLAAYGARVRVLVKEMGVRAAFGDYLELFHPTIRSRDYRHDLTDMCYESKELARDAHPDGIWNVMMHQISRSGRAEAIKRSPRHYIASDYGESSGIERSVSQLVWIYSDEPLKADRQARVGMALVRAGGAPPDGEEVFFDPEHAFVAERHS